jgi:protein-S-isoprenylcysteine O-methyltransferase Ste14
VSLSNQDHPQVMIPPPLCFLALLVIAGVFEYGLELDYARGPLAWRAFSALIVTALAGYLALHAVVVLKRRGTFVDPGKPTTRIVDEGPFRISRNPMYLSLVLALLAFSVGFLSLWFLLATAALWRLLDRFAIGPEESYLELKFGAGYLEYKARVPRWI